MTSRVSEHVVASLMTELEDDTMGDPAWCKGVNPRKCTPKQKEKCKETCGIVAPVAATATQEAPAREVAKFSAVNEGMSQAELMGVAKTDGYKSSWPVDCSGNNNLGGRIADSVEEAVALANGFRCTGDRVHPINNMAWRLPKESVSMCCNGECANPKHCGFPPHTFATGVAATIGNKALNVREFTTKGGKKVQVNVAVATSKKRADVGVVVEVEVRMLGSLEFVPAEAILTPEGEEFLLDLGSSLGTLVSQQMSAFPLPDGRAAKVVLCVHAETTATKEGLETNPANTELGVRLPEARAIEAIETLQSEMEADVATLGAPNAHFNQEQPFYRSNRRAFILYKIYDPSFPEPPCEHDDLYPFVKNYADRL